MRSKTKKAAAIAAILMLSAAYLPADSGWFGIHIGSDGFGFSFGYYAWEPYGDLWDDPYWSVDFHSALDPYGEWIWVAGLGWVWKPWVAASWRPYTWGRWVWSSYGWTWVAYEPWGYIPHHFGRWAFTGWGWVWVPGYVWTPASVVWLHCGNYVGWYPAPPPGWHYGYRHGYRDGYRDGYWDGYRDGRWATWVRWRDFYADNVASRSLSWEHVSRGTGRALPERMSSPPSRSYIERTTGSRITPVKLSQRTVTVDGKKVTFLRPEGVTRSIARNASDTVNKALAPKARRTLTSSNRTITPQTRSSIRSQRSANTLRKNSSIRANTTLRNRRTVTPSTNSKNKKGSLTGATGISSRRKAYAGSSLRSSTFTSSRTLSRRSRSSTVPNSSIKVDRTRSLSRSRTLSRPSSRTQTIHRSRRPSSSSLSTNRSTYSLKRKASGGSSATRLKAGSSLKRRMRPAGSTKLRGGLAKRR